MKNHQTKLFSIPSLSSKFGGDYVESHPKSSRPVSKKSPMHLVLKSDLARGRYSMLLKARKIEKVIQEQAQKHGVKVLSFVNVGNHLHLFVQLGHRRALARFLRSVCGVIAKEMWRGESNRLGLGEKIKNFWTGRPFSRIVKGFKDFVGVQKYLFLNELEVFGVSKEEGRKLLAGIQRRLVPHELYAS